uniref:DENN domain containing 4C n=1 Tax=Rousettus aegyptiacus TaxID=9407 RepID=A0A7J8II57_ROUAE|nr:DENN domain containing 4C [Rousettus aegyptiacus]
MSVAGKVALVVHQMYYFLLKIQLKMQSLVTLLISRMVIEEKKDKSIFQGGVVVLVLKAEQECCLRRAVWI